MTSNDGPLTEILVHFTCKEEMHLANIFSRDFAKHKTLGGELSSDFVWGKTFWPPAFWRLLELNKMIRHIMIKGCLDFHVVKKYENISQGCSGIRFQTSCVSFCVHYTLNESYNLPPFKLYLFCLIAIVQNAFHQKSFACAWTSVQQYFGVSIMKCIVLGRKCLEKTLLKRSLARFQCRCE